MIQTEMPKSPQKRKVAKSPVKSRKPSPRKKSRKQMPEEAEVAVPITAEPGDGVGRSDALDQPLGDGPQQVVAGGVPERVVHRLEVVEVEEGDAERRRTTA